MGFIACAWHRPIGHGHGICGCPDLGTCLRARPGMTGGIGAIMVRCRPPGCAGGSQNRRRS
eukprot:1905743-Prymnesium_polylepis.2